MLLTWSRYQKHSKIVYNTIVGCIMSEPICIISLIYIKVGLGHVTSIIDSESKNWTLFHLSITFANNVRFLPRDAMHKLGICRHAVSVCLSVRLSRSWVAPKRIKISSKFFHHLVATPFYSGWRCSNGNPPNGGVECKGGMKNWRFSTNISESRCISETVIVRWAHAARQFVGIEFSFHPYNI